MTQQVKFGPKQLSKPTPVIAKYAFRVCSILTTVAFFIMASDVKLKDAIDVIRVGVYLKAFDMLVLLLSQMFGISTDVENLKSNQDSKP